MTGARIPLWHGLAMRQTLANLVVALVVGLAIGAVELVRDWQTWREDIAKSTERTMLLVRDSAAEASYQLNTDQAGNVINGLLRFEFMAEVELRDNFDNVLATGRRAIPREGVPRMGERLLAGIGEQRMPLDYVERGGFVHDNVGVLTARLDAAVVGGRFMEMALAKLAVRVLWALLLSLCLTVIFYWVMIRPLVRIERAISDVDPADPARRPIPLPTLHARNELGHVVHAFNELLMELHGTLEKRRKAEAELERLNRDLEERVTARTHELNVAMGELAVKKDAAEQAARAKSAFLATMSHEIRTPLNAIMGMAEILARTEMTDEQRDYVRIFREAGGNLLRITNEILDLSRIEASEIEIRREDFSLADMLAESTRDSQVLAGAKRLGFTCECAPDVPRWVHGDAGRLGQCLRNLVDNAVKFSEQGEITLRVAVPAETGSMIRFEVADTGIGIPADKLGRIFEPFTQGDDSFTRRHGGTGLGLTIVKRLIECMGGTVSVASEPGRGSCFGFSIPLPEVSEPADHRGAEKDTTRPEAPPESVSSAGSGMPARVGFVDFGSVLQNLGGDKEIAGILIGGVLEDLPARLLALRQAIEAGDLASGQREAHTLKGLAASGGAGVLREIASRIEIACRDGQAEQAGVCLPELEQAAARVMPEWRQYLANLGDASLESGDA